MNMLNSQQYQNFLFYAMPGDEGGSSSNDDFDEDEKPTGDRD
jgi:hypothetical protein